MKRTCGRVVGAGGLVSALALWAAPGAQAATRDELVGAVKEATVAFLNALEEDPDKMDKGRACVAAAEAAVAGGVEEAAEIQIEASVGKYFREDEVPGRRTDEAWNHLFPLSSVRDWLCKKMLGEVAAARAATGAGRGAVWIGELALGDKSPKAGDLHLMTFAVEEARTCSARVAEAIAAGVPRDRVLDFYHYDARIEGAKREGASTFIALGELDAKVCKPAFDGAGAAVKKILAAEAAKYAPFLKALGGDKLKTFKERKLLGYVVRGPGGRELTTPEDFRDAAAWYTCGLDTTGTWPTWSVDGWKWKGMKLAGKYSKSGIGSDYPRGVFP